MTNSGKRRWIANSAARVITSPTAEPIAPPMKPNSMTARTSGVPMTVAVP